MDDRSDRPASTNPNDRNQAVLAHLAGLASFLVPILGGVFAAWMARRLLRNASKFVADQGRESLNFQITAALAMLLCLPLIPFRGLGLALMGIVQLANLALIIAAAVKAGGGIAFRYPFAWRLVK